MDTARMRLAEATKLDEKAKLLRLTGLHRRSRIGFDERLAYRVTAIAARGMANKMRILMVGMVAVLMAALNCPAFAGITAISPSDGHSITGDADELVFVLDLGREVTHAQAFAIYFAGRRDLLERPDDFASMSGQFWWMSDADTEEMRQEWLLALRENTDRTVSVQVTAQPGDGPELKVLGTRLLPLFRRAGRGVAFVPGEREIYWRTFPLDDNGEVTLEGAMPAAAVFRCAPSCGGRVADWYARLLVFGWAALWVIVTPIVARKSQMLDSTVKVLNVVLYFFLLFTPALAATHVLSEWAMHFATSRAYGSDIPVDFAVMGEQWRVATRIIPTFPTWERIAGVVIMVISSAVTGIIVTPPSKDGPVGTLVSGFIEEVRLPLPCAFGLGLALWLVGHIPIIDMLYMLVIGILVFLPFAIIGVAFAMAAAWVANECFLPVASLVEDWPAEHFSGVIFPVMVAMVLVGLLMRARRAEIRKAAGDEAASTPKSSASTDKPTFATLLIVSAALFVCSDLLNQVVRWTGLQIGPALSGVWHTGVTWALIVLPWSWVVHSYARERNMVRKARVLHLLPGGVYLVLTLLLLVVAPTNPRRSFEWMAGTTLPEDAGNLQYHLPGNGEETCSDTYYCTTTPREIDRLIAEMRLTPQSRVDQSVWLHASNVLADSPDWKSWRNPTEYRQRDTDGRNYFLLTDRTKTQVLMHMRTRPSE